MYARASQYPPYKDCPYAICSQPHRTGPTLPVQRGHTHSDVSALRFPTLSGSVPLSDVPNIYLRMRRPLSCTQGHAHRVRCQRCLTVTAQLAARVPRHSRAHSAAMGIGLTGSAWVLVYTSIQPSAVWYSKNEQHTETMILRAPKHSKLYVC